MNKIFIGLFLIAILAACTNEQVMKPNTPMNAAYLMKFQIDNQNFRAFQSLFNENNENTITKEAFEQLHEISTAGANWKDYELITMNNGEMLLVEFAPLMDKQKEYKIVNVRVVPDELKDFFKK